MFWPCQPESPFEREFAVRFYRWARNQLEQELERDFPFLRSAAAAKVQGASDMLEIIRPHQPNYAALVARTLLTKTHCHAAALLGEPLTPDDQTFLKKIDHARTSLLLRPGWQVFWGIKRKEKGAEVRIKNLILQNLRKTVAPIVGTIKSDPSGPYAAIRIGSWQVETHFENRQTKGSHYLDYSQCIRTTPGKALFLARGVTALGSMGLCNTSWRNVSANNVPAATTFIAASCKRFLEAVPELLPSSREAF